MDERMLANARLLRARELIESVMAGLDTSLIDCPCPEHVRHFANWSDAQTHIRLQVLADRLAREANNDSVTDLTYREARQLGWTGEAEEEIEEVGGPIAIRPSA